jgi:hypothetical protein
MNLERRAQDANRILRSKTGNLSPDERPRRRRREIIEPTLKPSNAKPKRVGRLNKAPSSLPKARAQRSGALKNPQRLTPTVLLPFSAHRN